MEAILGAMPDLLFELDITGKIYNYHSRSTDLLTMPPEFFIGKNFPRSYQKKFQVLFCAK
jgi:hypothetical protein